MSVNQVVGIIVALKNPLKDKGDDGLVEYQNLLIPVPMRECDGQVDSLTFEYTGDDATIEVVQKQGNLPLDPVYVVSGDVFTIDGISKNKSTLGPQIEISVVIDGEETETICIHTSCSEPIGPGMVFTFPSGSTLGIVWGTSRYGGFLPPPDGTQSGDCKTNNGKKPERAPGQSSSLSTLWGNLKTK